MEIEANSNKHKDCGQVGKSGASLTADHAFTVDLHSSEARGPYWFSACPGVIMSYGEIHTQQDHRKACLGHPVAAMACMRPCAQCLCYREVVVPCAAYSGYQFRMYTFFC